MVHFSTSTTIKDYFPSTVLQDFLHISLLTACKETALSKSGGIMQPQGLNELHPAEIIVFLKYSTKQTPYRLVSHKFF